MSSIKETRASSEQELARLRRKVAQLQAAHEKSRRYEEALKQSERKFAVAFRSSPAAMGISTLEEGRYLDVNEKHSAIYGYSRNELTGHTSLELGIWADPQQRRQWIKNLREHGADYNFEITFRRKNGQLGAGVISAEIVELDGKPHILHTSIDITQSKLAESRLRNTLNTLQTIIEASPLAIITLDPDGRVTTWSRAAAEFLGWSPEEVMGGPPPHIPANRRAEYRQIMDQALAGQSIRNLETQRLRKDGSLIDVSLNAAPLTGQGGEALGVVVVTGDISEQKKAEQVLDSLHQELVREYEVRKRLSKKLLDLMEEDRRQVARELHDHLGQMLTTLRMNLETSLGKFVPGSDSPPPVLEDSIRKLDSMIKEIRRISRGLRPEMLEKLGLVSALRSLFNETADSTGIKVHFFPKGVPARFDREKELALFRIAQEAMTNVIKHSGAREVFIDIMPKGDALILSVEDDGKGFDEHQVASEAGGSGSLGLTLMRERAEQLGGEFSLESAPGRGTHLLAEMKL